MPLVDNQRLDRVTVTREVRELDAEGLEMLRRARFLLPLEREIVELVVRHRLSRRQVGRAMGLPHGTIARKLQRIGARLYAPVVPALIADRCPLPTEVRTVAIECLLQGLPYTEVADRHFMTVGEVKQMVQYAKGWFRGMSSEWTYSKVAKHAVAGRDRVGKGTVVSMA